MIGFSLDKSCVLMNVYIYSTFAFSFFLFFSIPTRFCYCSGSAIIAIIITSPMHSILLHSQLHCHPAFFITYLFSSMSWKRAETLFNFKWCDRAKWSKQRFSIKNATLTLSLLFSECMHTLVYYMPMHAFKIITRIFFIHSIFYSFFLRKLPLLVLHTYRFGLLLSFSHPPTLFWGCWQIFTIFSLQFSQLTAFASWHCNFLRVSESRRLHNIPSYITNHWGYGPFLV